MVKIALMIAATVIPPLAAAQGTTCTLRLDVMLTPDVENPKDPAFLSSLTGNPAYSLVLVSASDDSEVLQLSGPPNTCHNQVKFMRMNSHVIEMHIIGADGQEEDDEA